MNHLRAFTYWKPLLYINKYVFYFKNINDKSILWNQEYIETECEDEPNNCCIPGCIYSADYLNGKLNAKPRPVALFTPSSVVSCISIIY